MNKHVQGINRLFKELQYYGGSYFTRPFSWFMLRADFAKANNNWRTYFNSQELVFDYMEKETIICQERPYHPVVMIDLCKRNLLATIRELNDIENDLIFNFHVLGQPLEDEIMERD